MFLAVFLYFCIFLFFVFFLPGATKYSGFLHLLKQLVSPLCDQLADRRSSIVKQVLPSKITEINIMLIFLMFQCPGIPTEYSTFLCKDTIY